MDPTMVVMPVLWLRSCKENENTFSSFLLALSKSPPQLAVLEHSYSTLEHLQEVSFILISTDNRHRCLEQTEWIVNAK